MCQVRCAHTETMLRGSVLWGSSENQSTSPASSSSKWLNWDLNPDLPEPRALSRISQFTKVKDTSHCQPHVR